MKWIRHKLSLDRKTMDILVANIIPTTKYFESRFDHLQYQVSELKAGQKNLLEVMDKRFTAMQGDMDKRFTAMQSDMDKRFEQVDSRLDSLKSDMDKRFQQVDDKLDKILDRIDRRIDEGLRENRAQSMRMFTFAMMFSAISMIGLVGKMMKLF